MRRAVENDELFLADSNAHYVGYEALKERALECACEARRYGWSHCNFKREHEQLRLAVKRHIDQLPMRMPDMNAARILEDEDMLDSGCPF